MLRVRLQRTDIDDFDSIPKDQRFFNSKGIYKPWMGHGAWNYSILAKTPNYYEYVYEWVRREGDIYVDDVDAIWTDGKR